MRVRPLESCLLLAVLVTGCRSAEAPSAAEVRRDLELVINTTVNEAVVPRNATLESLLRQEEISAELATAMIEAVRGVFDPRDLKANQTYWVIRSLDGLFREFRYQIDPDRLLRVVSRDEPAPPAMPVDVEVMTLPKEYRTVALAAEISRQHNSLFAAFQAHDEHQQLPLKVAEIFSGEVDFNSELQLGDRFEVLFERAVREGEFVGYGEVNAAILEVGGRRITAFRHVTADGTVSWFDDQGRSLKRPFLKSPLDFNPRVTSGFSYNRYHPVHGTRRPHLGVDYGAPAGTPVKAVASGTVELASWNGEAGRMVRIRHAGGYKTAYLHLSGFAAGVTPGVRVEQGQMIGRVGMSGTATGPHLDYRVMLNGTYINPQTAFRNMPAGDPIDPSELAEFERNRDAALAQLEGALAMSLASAAGPSSSFPVR